MPFDERIAGVLGAILIAAIFGVRSLVVARRQERELDRELAEHWGAPFRRDRTSKPVQAMFEARSDDTDDAIRHDRIDDQTWEDLELRALFERVDHTLTAVGAQTLYRWLRRPSLSTPEGSARRSHARGLAADPELRVGLQRVLLKLRDRRGWNVASLVWRPIDRPAVPRFVLWGLALIVATSVPLGIALQHWPLLVAGLVIAFGNVLVHDWLNGRLGGQLVAMRDLGAVVATARAALGLLPDRLRPGDAMLRDIATAGRAMRRARGLSVPNPALDAIAEYFRSFFLTEARAFYALASNVETHLDALRRTVDFVGGLDAHLSLAREEQRAPTCEAVLDAAPGTISAQDLRPPWIESGEGNAVDIAGRGLIVTGSNMAGKSTFLRTVGTNVLVAQAFGFAYATRFAASPMVVRSSIHVRDDPTGGKSLFRAESERLLRLRGDAAAHGPALLLLDEPFRGTNPVDRVAAAGAYILDVGTDNVVIVATHDAGLAKLCHPVADPVYFAESLASDGADLAFDYRLRAGTLNRPNALRVLSHVGFPDQLVSRAQQIAKTMARSGA